MIVECVIIAKNEKTKGLLVFQVNKVKHEREITCKNRFSGGIIAMENEVKRTQETMVDFLCICMNFKTACIHFGNDSESGVTLVVKSL